MRRRAWPDLLGRAVFPRGLAVLQDRHKNGPWLLSASGDCVGCGNRTPKVAGQAERGQRVTVNMTKGQAISLQKSDGGP